MKNRISNTWLFVICMSIVSIFFAPNPVGATVSLNRVRYDASGFAYLVNDKEERLAGPFRYLEQNQERSEYSRYIGLNGKYGYVDYQGNVITSPDYVTASEFSNYTAVVSEDGDKVYFIDYHGEKISREYLDAFPFEENGDFARVKLEDGSWGIINRFDQIIAESFDKIPELPATTPIGSGVMGGIAVIFSLDYVDGTGFKITKAMKEFVDISSIYPAGYAIVKNSQGLYGVIDCDGNLLIQDDYLEIEAEMIDAEEGAMSEVSGWDNIVFRLEKPDGNCDVIVYRPYAEEKIFIAK